MGANRRGVAGKRKVLCITCSFYASQHNNKLLHLKLLHLLLSKRRQGRGVALSTCARRGGRELCVDRLVSQFKVAQSRTQ